MSIIHELAPGAWKKHEGTLYDALVVAVCGLTSGQYDNEVLDGRHTHWCTGDHAYYSTNAEYTSDDVTCDKCIFVGLQNLRTT